MKQFLAGKIRNIALAGHGGSGKTSLGEALLFRAGEIDRLGKIADGNTTFDFDPEEVRRQASVSSSVYPFVWDNTKINLIDTPGLFDYAGGMCEGLRAAESVLIALSAKSGVEVGTWKAWQMAGDMKRARMFFIGKMDEENADYYKVLGDLREAFGSSVCPLTVPCVKDGKVQCYVNLVDNKAYTYNQKGEAAEMAMPDMPELSDWRDAISEAVAESDETLFEKFFSGETFTREELIAGIRKGVRSGTFTPVLCGSGYTLEGINMLLDSIVHHLPSAEDSAGETAKKEDGGESLVPCSESEPLAAYVFKTVADPFVGKLSYVKVVSGKLSGDITPVNTRTGQPERLGKIIHVKGKKQEETQALTAGDIGAITKLGETVTGDSLCDPKRPLIFDKIAFPHATLSMAIRAKNKGDEGKVSAGIQRLMEEDPSIGFELNAETRQQVLSGLGEQHLDIVVSKLKAKFGVEIELINPRVPYRETIRKKVKVEGKHKKQTGGHGQFGHVWIEFEPHGGDQLVFETNVFGGSVPKNFFPAVEKGLQEAVSRGVIAGYPVVGLRAILVDGSYHPVDSSEMAFKTAASLAYKAGVAQAGPVLLEPIGHLKVTVPDSNTGDIMGELNKRRGRVLGMNPVGAGLQEVEGEAPMSEMHDFTTYLRSATQGRGSFTFDFERYEQLPANLEEAVKEDAKKMSEEE
ncbi:MAG: elongation factor G [Oscillospiraceae bacterium]|jgi:elongation factor G|nr:elongation factor G [Oscillospiraceae bacterium]